jgi:hypothetical protein
VECGGSRQARLISIQIGGDWTDLSRDAGVDMGVLPHTESFEALFESAGARPGSV